jgi:isoaspartyl peptidase/L-asparaginase-like protein (Ntn-hydrolase superfamily)
LFFGAAIACRPIPDDVPEVKSGARDAAVPTSATATDAALDEVENSGAARRTPATFAGGEASGILAVTHGGAGSPPALSDGPQAAAQAARDRLEAGADALSAAIAGTVVLEDDPRFNAGTGANIRLDGATIQMDAALMTSAGRFAAVAVIERVRNPIEAARLVLDSPHVLLAGEGATRFAHKLGMADEVPRAPEAEAKYERRLAELRAALAERGVEDDGVTDWAAYWNFPGAMPPALARWREGGDTVGTVTRDRQGRFAATLSTGGTSVTLYGRVGDVPVYGAGLFAGERGAVACTGEGEEIIRQGLARAVYAAMAEGRSAADAVAAAAVAFPKGQAVGLIAVDHRGWGVAANVEMAYGVATPAAPVAVPSPGR